MFWKHIPDPLNFWQYLKKYFRYCHFPECFGSGENLKCSEPLAFRSGTPVIQRRLQIGYNRAASLMERMEQEGIVGQANHAGKREILVPEEEGNF